MRKIAVGLLSLGLGVVALADGDAGFKVCAAIRGNGQYIFTHFAALARLTENYGPMEALAGGSSGSISAFLYESIAMNRAVKECGEKRPCTDRERALRIAFLLKSLEEYLDVVRHSPEALAIEGLSGLAREIQKKGIEASLQNGDLITATAALRTILASDELKSLVNRKVLKMIEAGRAAEVVEMVKNFGDFKADNVKIFFRPGVVDFDNVPAILGKIGDFYAGRGPGAEFHKLSKLLNRCATEKTSEGRLWAEIKLNKSSECAPEFHKMIERYRKSYDPTANFDHRIKDSIGQAIPTLISTSILKGSDLVDQWRDNEEKYLKDPKYQLDFQILFDRVRFGYWGRPQDLKRIDKKFQGSDDLKSQKFLAMGPKNSVGADWTPWEEALRTSPAEPGISAIQPIDDEHLSVGGWSDLQEVTVLQEMGCLNVAYITRQDPESQFAVGVAKQLGMQLADENRLYTLGKQANGTLSSFQRALDDAQGVWCTEWDKFAASDIAGMIQNSYRATLITKAPYFLAPQGTRPPQLRQSSTAVGCARTSVGGQ